MMDDIIEAILGLILDGMVEAAGSKKVPMPIRIALSTVLGLLAAALFGILLWVGISSGSVPLIVLDIVLLAACITWVCFKVKKYKIKKH
ncbi:MAG: hypothetical protein J6J18_04325 [Oscillospiraceae bacterium]|nr:hypothetical protein [Oscillospiraceae bacterium]